MELIPNTKVHLLTNVPFNNSYSNVRLFDNRDKQEQYFSQKVTRMIDNTTYQRMNSNSIKVNFNADELMNINYMMFQNTNYTNKWIYAFVISVDYIAPSTASITYEIDVMQTFMFDFNFKESFVEREHRQRYNKSTGLPNINTVDEGLDYGTMYDIVDTQNYIEYKYDDVSPIIYMILVSAVELTNGLYGGSSIQGMGTSLYYYCIPLVVDSSASPLKVNGTVVSSPTKIIQQVATNPSLVNKIVSMYYIDFLPVKISYANASRNISSSYLKVKTGNGITLATIDVSYMQEKIFNYGDKYKKLPKYDESKLLMYPYSLLEVTDFRGHTFTIKPEYIQGKELKINIKSSITFKPKKAVIVNAYNGGDMNTLENGYIDSDPNDIPIIDNYTASYIQGNKNVIASQMQYTTDNAARSVYQNTASNRLNNSQIDTQQGFNSLNAGFGIVGNLLGGNVAGALQSGVSSVEKMTNLEYSRQQANMNTRFANQNARVNAEQTIGMQLAKMQDINNMPPNISNMGNDAIFSFSNWYVGVNVVAKTLKPEYANKLSAYFKMFGYRVNDVKIPQLHTRENWNYIKTSACNIDADIPNAYLTILRSLFDRGITLWHTDNMQDYSQSNNEI